MSADPSSDLTPESSEAARLPLSPAEEPPKFLTQKRRYRKPGEADEEDQEGDEIEEAALLSALLRNARRRRKQKNASGNRERLRGTINRFVARASGSVSSGKGESPFSRGANALPKFRPSAYIQLPISGDPTARPWVNAILYFGFPAALALAAYLVGRAEIIPNDTAAVRAPVAATTALWRATDSEQWVRAIDADHAGDLSTAFRLINELAKSVELTPKLRAYRATLQVRLGYVHDLEWDLARYLGPDTPLEASASINTARGFNNVRLRLFDDALKCFAAVARADPSDVTNLVHWAETLRRQGHSSEAADKFQDALTRLSVTGSAEAESEGEYIAYERRLSQVESGADLQTELARRLAAPAPSGYWLLTAAAAALQKGDIPTAVAALQKAQAVLQPEPFRDLLGDYFFRSFAHHPEINVFLTSLSPAQQQARRQSMQYFIDP